MKRILITGEDSYIGTHFAAYLSGFSGEYAVETLAMKGHTPDEYAFHGADAIVHVAAIVHRKETKETPALYEKINCDLAYAVAEQAKREGVKQFVFFSSMSVYGKVTGTITKDTVPAPDTQYGKSKLSAERRIAALADESFCVTILRPPRVFGPGAKGNPARLEQIANRLPFCPDFENRRSMVSIDTLCEALKGYIDAPRSGVFFPQETAPLSTAELMERMRKAQNKPVRRSKLLNPAIRALRRFTRAGKKAFGDLTYEDLTELPLRKEEAER